MSAISDMIAGYQTWLRDKTVLTELRDWTKVTTPYLDRHNDYLEIYIRRKDDAFELTDDGQTLQDLEMSGCKLDTPHRQSLLNLTLRGFGIQRDRNSLSVKATKENFSVKKHNLIQTMLAVNDLFVLAGPTTRNLFLDDVRQWLDDADVRYVPTVTFQGVSGFTQVFDFAIPKSKKISERLLKVISNPTREKAQNLAFAWHDIREIRPEDGLVYAVLNDSEKAISDNILEALRAYQISPVAWSNRNVELECLAA